jgi:hypothetical protein
MKTLPRILLCLSFALLASCADEDDVVKPKPETGAPIAQAADLPDSLDLRSSAPNARAAQARATELFTAVFWEAGMARAVLYPTRDLPWSRTGDGCWRASYTPGTDPLSLGVYRACPAAGGHTWRFDLIQLCSPAVICSCRPIARGETGENGATGAFSRYSRYDSTRVVSSWQWIASAGADSIHWTFYQGEIEPAAYSAAMDWCVDESGARTWIWVWPVDERWEMEVQADPATGWLKDYLWNGSKSAWILSDSFAWSGGHGTWNRCDEAGEVIETLGW